MINKAVILCGGNGTRFLPYTKAVPKEMLAVVDKPAMQLLVEEVTSAGITDVLVVIAPHKQAIKNYFEKDEAQVKALYASGKTEQAKALENISNLANVSFVYQNKVDGTASAVQLAKDFVGGESFAVLNGDDVIFNQGVSATQQLVCAYQTFGGSAVVGVQKVKRSEICKYASCVLQKGSSNATPNKRIHPLNALVEKPSQKDAPSLFAPLGRYIFESSIFDAMTEIPVHENGEKYLPDAINVLAQKGNVFACEFVGTRYDFGDKLGYAKAVTDFSLSSPFGNEYRKYLLKAILKNKRK